MGRHSCCIKQKLRKGLWSPEEDEKLLNYITRFGVGCWSSVPKLAGLQRCGKSCRLRWINYLRPDLKRGMFSQQEEDLILRLHEVLGNRWAQIAAQLPGRTDNEIKNFWNSCLKKRLLKQGIDPNTHQPLSEVQVRDEENRTTDPKESFQIPFSITDQLSHLSASTSASSGMDREFQMRSASYNVGGETSRDQPMVSKQVFDPQYLLEFQASIHPCGYQTNFLPLGEQIVRSNNDHDQNEFEEGISRGYAAFSSMPTLTNFDQVSMTETDFSDSPTSRMSSLMVNEAKESSSNRFNITRSHSNHHPTIQINKMAANLDVFSWNAVNKFESVFEYHVTGIKTEERQLQIQTHNSGDFCNNPLTSLSDEDLSGASLDVLHQI